MAFTFNLLRENDLFWSYWTNNYLKGLKPAAFDLLYWNTDGTNLPYRMHSYYLREMYLHNRLVQPDALTMNGETINLSEVRSEEHTSELQSRPHLVCRLLLEKKKKKKKKKT